MMITQLKGFVFTLILLTFSIPLKSQDRNGTNDSDDQTTTSCPIQVPSRAELEPEEYWQELMEVLQSQDITYNVACATYSCRGTSVQTSEGVSANEIPDIMQLLNQSGCTTYEFCPLSIPFPLIDREDRNLTMSNIGFNINPRGSDWTNDGPPTTTIKRRKVEVQLVNCTIIPVCSGEAIGEPISISISKVSRESCKKGESPIDGIPVYQESLDDEIADCLRNGGTPADCLRGETNQTGQGIGKNDVSYNPVVKAIQHSAQPTFFQQSTNINYTLPQDATVSLMLYNVQGQQVATVLPPTPQTAGTYQQWVDGSNLPKGMYFYQLQVNEQQTSGKLIKVE